MTIYHYYFCYTGKLVSAGLVSLEFSWSTCFRNELLQISIMGYFTGWMFLMLTNQQCQSTEGNTNH